LLAATIPAVQRVNIPGLGNGGESKIIRELICGCRSRELAIVNGGIDFLQQPRRGIIDNGLFRSGSRGIDSIEMRLECVLGDVEINKEFMIVGAVSLRLL